MAQISDAQRMSGDEVMREDRSDERGQGKACKEE